MEIQKTTGIVLSSKEFGEADILSIIHTETYGKRKFVFKGLRKSKRRPMSAIEPGTHIHIIYYYHQEKDSYIVNEFTVEKYYSEFHKNLQRVFHLYFILETVEKTIGFNIQDKKTYSLLSGGINTLAETDHWSHLTAFFLIRHLTNHGMWSYSSTCSKCSTNSFTHFYFDITDLNIVCKSCYSNKSSGLNKSHIFNMMFNESVRNFLILSLKNKFGKLEYNSFDENGILNFIYVASLFIEHYYHIKLKSKEFILSKAYQ